MESHPQAGQAALRWRGDERVQLLSCRWELRRDGTQEAGQPLRAVSKSKRKLVSSGGRGPQEARDRKVGP